MPSGILYNKKIQFIPNTVYETYISTEIETW
jgi:hypothetical protein